jgi:hypothetical protein
MFMLDKWYLDVSSARGDVAILYAARLRWGALRVRYASALEDSSDGTHHESRTIRGIEPPRHDGDMLVWQNEPLRIDGRWHRDTPPVRRLLASSAAGSIRWSCHAPRARAQLHLGATVYDGLGYAERLRLTMPPRALPFDTLRWGRHLSPRHALVWIDWRGAEHRCWVWLDGEAQPDAVVTDQGVSRLGGGAELCIGTGRDVVDRAVLPAFADVLPALARRAVGPVATMHEHKRVERSAIVKAGERIDDGWTVRELVTW